MTSLTKEDGFGESDKIGISVQIKDLSLRVFPQVTPSTEQPSRSVSSSKLFPSAIQSVMSRSDVSSAMAKYSYLRRNQPSLRKLPVYRFSH